MTTYANESIWLEARRRGIGASEAAIIMGLSPWGSPFQIYLEKRGEVERPKKEGDQLSFGNRFENAVIDEFEARKGKVVRRSHLEIFRHPDHEILTCSPDGWIEGENAGVEAKTSSPYDKSIWEMGVPLWYEAQAQHQMMVMGWDRVWIPVYFDDRSFEIFCIDRDDEMIALMVEIELEFWQMVLDGVPPAVGSDDGDVLARLYPWSKKESKALSEHEYKLVERAKDIGYLIKGYEQEQDLIKNQLKAYLGEMEIGTYLGRKIVSWASQTRSDVDRKRLKEEAPELYEQFKKTTEFRVLRLFENKEKLYE